MASQSVEPTPHRGEPTPHRDLWPGIAGLVAGGLLIAGHLLRWGTPDTGGSDAIRDVVTSQRPGRGNEASEEGREAAREAAPEEIREAARNEVRPSAQARPSRLGPGRDQGRLDQGRVMSPALPKCMGMTISAATTLPTSRRRVVVDVAKALTSRSP